MRTEMVCCGKTRVERVRPFAMLRDENSAMLPEPTTLTTWAVHFARCHHGWFGVQFLGDATICVDEEVAARIVPGQKYHIDFTPAE